MNVTIKDFQVDMEVRTNGIEFEVRDPGGTHRGDCYLTKTGLIWCQGKTPRRTGITVMWDEFINWMNNRGA